MNKINALRVLRIGLVISVPAATTLTVEVITLAGDATVQTATVEREINRRTRARVKTVTMAVPGDHDRPIVATRSTLVVTEVGPEIDRAVRARRDRLPGRQSEAAAVERPAGHATTQIQSAEIPGVPRDRDTVVNVMLIIPGAGVRLVLAAIAMGKVMTVPGDGIPRILVLMEIAPVVAERRGTPPETGDAETLLPETALGERAPSRTTRAARNTGTEVILAPVETEEGGASNPAPTRVVSADGAAAQDMVATETNAGHGMRSPEVVGTRRE